MKQVILHCGLPKTGTTTIQHYLSSAREFLAQHDCCYPVCGTGSDGSAHHNISRDILGESSFDPARGGVSGILDEIAAQKHSRILISSEGLTHCLFRNRDGLFQFLSRLKQQCDTLAFLFTFRQFWKITESTFLHDLRQSPIGKLVPLRDRTARAERWLERLSGALRELGELTGEENVLACDVEEHGDAVHALNVKLPFLPASDQSISVRNSRSGLTKASMLYRLHLYGHGNDRDVPDAAMLRLRRLILAAPAAPDEIFSYRLLTDAQCERIQQTARLCLPAFVKGQLTRSLGQVQESARIYDLATTAYPQKSFDAIAAGIPAKMRDVFVRVYPEYSHARSKKAPKRQGTSRDAGSGAA
jgi:hypothetical protein